MKKLIPIFHLFIE